MTIEFLGPLTLAAVLSRRPRDLVAVLAAGLGVALVSGAFDSSWDRFDKVGIAFAATAGAMWAAYIVLSQRTGRAFAGLDGLALALVVSTVVVAPLGLTTVDRWTWQDVALGLGIAVLSSVLPYSLELVALRHLAQRVFGVLLSLEPAVAALAGLRRAEPGARPCTDRGDGARRHCERHRARLAAWRSERAGRCRARWSDGSGPDDRAGLTRRRVVVASRNAFEVKCT